MLHVRRRSLLVLVGLLALLTACSATREPVFHYSGPSRLELAGKTRQAVPVDIPITLHNDGNAVLAFVASSDRDWLRVQPDAGTLSPSEDQVLELDVSCPDTASDAYQARLTVRSNAPRDHEMVLELTLRCDLPSLGELELTTWNELNPGGATTCAKEDPYAFFVYPGDAKQVLVDFQGGGACWDDRTCGIDDLYQQRVEGAPEPTGIYDKARADNPFAGWTHVHVPYCTADIHLGDALASYEVNGETFTLQHRGAVNVRAVLDWIVAAIEAPEVVFVTGCSAGAYGSVVWAPYLQRAYPAAAVHQLGDCGAGIVTEHFMNEGITRWNVTPALPTFTGVSDTLEVDFIEQLYQTNGVYLSGRVSQYNSSFDWVQALYYALMDPSVRLGTILGLMGEWPEALTASLERISQTTDGFVYYTSDLPNGDEWPLLGRAPEGVSAHCIITRPEFYTLEVADTPLVDWLADLLAGEQVVSVSPPVDAPVQVDWDTVDRDALDAFFERLGVEP